MRMKSRGVMSRCLLALAMAVGAPVLAGQAAAPGPIELLKAARFAELDARMGAVQSDWKKGRIDDVALVAAFRPFHDADPALGPLYEAWVKASPRSYVARLAKGDYEVHAGRRARGSAFSANTSDDQFRAMAAADARARQALQASLALDDRPILSYWLLIDLTRHGDADPDARHLLDAGLRLDPHNYVLRLRYMSTLETRWGGSASEMAAFLHECQSAGLDTAKLRALQAMVERDLGWLAGQDGDLAEADRHDLAAVELAGDGRLIEKGIYGVMLRTAGYDEERQKRLDSACRLYERAVADSPDDAWTWGHLGYCRSLAGKKAESAQAYRRGAELGDRYAQNEWGKVLWFGVAPMAADRAGAVPWFEKAAAAGLPEAIKNLDWARKQVASPH